MTMYVPEAFRVDDRATLHDFIDDHSFALIATANPEGPFVTHLPLLLDREAGPNGTLLGHVAGANPHARTLFEYPVTAVFTGPHAYVSPAWYEAENVVPTWNYTAVHAMGHAERIDDRDELDRLIRRTVDRYERTRPVPWTLGVRTTFLDRLTAHIVGFRIPIDRIEGKFKLSQNHPMERRRRVVEGLIAEGTASGCDVADLMRRSLDSQGI